MKISKLLTLWVDNNLITEFQKEKITSFMKERRRTQFFRLLKWLFILGTMWLIFGLIATIYNILQLHFMEKFLKFLIQSSQFIWQIIQNIFTTLQTYILTPVYQLIYKCFGDNSKYFIWAIVSFILYLLFTYLEKRIKPDKDIDKLNLSAEQKRILKTNFTFDTISCVCLSAVFCLLNMLLISPDKIYESSKVFPFFDILGCVTFFALAYIKLKPMYLLFGIYFLALCSGMFWGYSSACYWIGASKPIIQCLIGFILILLGYITNLKLKLNNTNDEDKCNIQEKFYSIYNWTGLFILFIALWIMSFWGMDLHHGSGTAETLELWITNILFILISILSMYYGTKTEQKIFFNYGLTFLFIETYTVLCSRLWDGLPIGVASLLLGALLIATGKILQNIYLKKVK